MLRCSLAISQQLNGLVMYVASYDCSQIYIVCCSYSHCVFTIKLVQTSNAAKPTCARVNRISIVDLAGSERTAKTQAIGTRAKEAGSINISLMVL